MYYWGISSGVICSDVVWFEQQEQWTILNWIQFNCEKLKVQLFFILYWKNSLNCQECQSGEIERTKEKTHIIRNSEMPMVFYIWLLHIMSYRNIEFIL